MAKVELRVGDAELVYQVFGRGKRDLLFLHGYSIQSTGTLYANLYESLGDAFTVFAFDMRGHRHSSHVNGSWTMAQVAGDIASAVRALGVRDTVHAGHSFGGFMGLLTELLHPGTFSALVLLAPSAASGGKATPEEVKSTITNEGRNGEIMGGLYKQMYVRAIDDPKVQPALGQMKVYTYGKPYLPIFHALINS